MLYFFNDATSLLFDIIPGGDADGASTFHCTMGNHPVATALLRVSKHRTELVFTASAASGTRFRYVV
jgi:hypothetical protein